MGVPPFRDLPLFWHEPGKPAGWTPRPSSPSTLVHPISDSMFHGAACLAFHRCGVAAPNHSIGNPTNEGQELIANGKPTLAPLSMLPFSKREDYEVGRKFVTPLPLISALTRMAVPSACQEGLTGWTPHPSSPSAPAHLGGLSYDFIWTRIGFEGWCAPGGAPEFFALIEFYIIIQ